MRATAVIGSFMGDEGKGRMVHHFASSDQSSAVVVRHNGGAQAGHTVLRQGVGHIFHHFGAGTLDGAATYLSEFFIANPLIWAGENKDLCSKLGAAPVVYVHPDTPLTTPYDMLINREVERSRGNDRHGSCGYGVNETVERLCKTAHHLFVRDIESPDFPERVRAIRDRHVPQRLAALGIESPTDGFREACASDALFEGFLRDAREFRRSSTVMSDDGLQQWAHVIFEGSQGLCLDERHAFFPHVTRSRTGLSNIVTICQKAGIQDIEAVYVTRAYATRHGHGPLPTEVTGLKYDDPTNVPNEWQGEIRFGHLDVDLIRESVRNDLARSGSLQVKPSLAITCMDQVGDVVKVGYRGQLRDVQRDRLPKLVAGAIGAGRVYLSWRR